MRSRSAYVFAIVLLVATVPTYSQTVIITPKTTVYRRPKPQHDFKRSFTVRRPIAKASTATLSRKITAAVSPEKVLGLNVREELSEYQWLEEADYKVLFNQNGVLCVELWMMGTAAYPDSVTKTVVIDIRRGVTVAVQKVFTDLPRLAGMVQNAQAAEVAAAKKAIALDPNARPEELFRNTDFTVDDFAQFTVDSRGVAFIYDYGFPHVFEALAPAGRFHFTWAQLKSFIRSDSLLARFVR